jgi:hypothetical protein
MIKPEMLDCTKVYLLFDIAKHKKQLSEFGKDDLSPQTFCKPKSFHTFIANIISQ